MTLEETTQGAKNRAMSAASMEAASAGEGGNQSVLGMGIESGLFEVEGKMFDVCCCAIWDGLEHHVG